MTKSGHSINVLLIVCWKVATKDDATSPIADMQICNWRNLNGTIG